MLTRPDRRLQLLHEGWREAMTPFLLAVALMTIRFVYPLELLFMATVLALVPYALLRGPFNRLARLFLPAAQAPTVVEETHRAKPNTMSNEAVTDPLPQKRPAGGVWLLLNRKRGVEGLNVEG